MTGAGLFIRHGQEAANDIGPQALGRFGRQLDAVLQHWHWEVRCGPDIGFPQHVPRRVFGGSNVKYNLNHDEL